MSDIKIAAKNLSTFAILFFVEKPTNNLAMADDNKTSLVVFCSISISGVNNTPTIFDKITGDHGNPYIIPSPVVAPATRIL